MSQAVVNQYFKAINAYDFVGLESIFAANFTHEFRPASLGGMGIPVRNASQFIDFLKDLKKLIIALNVSRYLPNATYKPNDAPLAPSSTRRLRLLLRRTLLSSMCALIPVWLRGG